MTACLHFLIEAVAKVLSRIQLDASCATQFSFPKEEQIKI